MSTDTLLVNTIFRRVHAITVAKTASPEPQKVDAVPASTPPEPIFPSAWFESLAKPAFVPTSKIAEPIKPTNRRQIPAIRPVSDRPLFSSAFLDLGTDTIVIVPIYRASSEALRLGTDFLLVDQDTIFVGLLMQIGTMCLCWTVTALPSTATAVWVSLGAIMVDGAGCPDPLKNALASGAVVVCADYELTSGFYRCTGWPNPSRWYDILATTSALNFPGDIAGIATVIGRTPLSEALAGLLP